MINEQTWAFVALAAGVIIIAVRICAWVALRDRLDEMTRHLYVISSRLEDIEASMWEDGGPDDDAPDSKPVANTNIFSLPLDHAA